MKTLKDFLEEIQRTLRFDNSNPEWEMITDFKEWISDFPVMKGKSSYQGYFCKLNPPIRGKDEVAWIRFESKFQTKIYYMIARSGVDDGDKEALYLPEIKNDLEAQRHISTYIIDNDLPQEANDLDTYI